MKFFIFILLIGLNIFAAERIEFYNGIRGLGMGDTSVAIVNDETGLISNPAGLGKLRNYFGTIVDPEIDLGSSAVDLYRGKSYSNPFSLSQVLPVVAVSPGDYFSSRGQIFPSFVARNFGIGILAKYNLAAIADSATAVNAFYRDDLALLFGYNFRFFEGRVKLGFTGKFISRIEVNETGLDPSGSLDLPTLASQNKAREGMGIGVDVGLLLSAPVQNIPTLGIVLRDIGNTSYDKTYISRLSTTEDPANTKQDADIGASFQIIHKPNIRSVWTIEYRGLLTASDEEDKQKLLHAGFEFNFGDVFFLRGGFNQRYYTTGFELASERFQFQIAYYGEEVGTSAAPKEDRRTVFKFSFRF